MEREEKKKPFLVVHSCVKVPFYYGQLSTIFKNAMISKGILYVTLCLANIVCPFFVVS